MNSGDAPEFVFYLYIIIICKGGNKDGKNSYEFNVWAIWKA